MTSFTRGLALAVSALLFLGACQAPATPQALSAAPEALSHTALDPHGPFPADLHELDVVAFEAPVDAPLTMPITYRRGVEEQVSWEGTGDGTAELWNAHGQLIYRVREGEASQTLTVSAGRYSLVITPDPGEPASAMLLLATPKTDGAGVTREILDLAETGPSALPPRGQADPCQEARDAAERLGELRRELDEMSAQWHPDVWREKQVKRDYLIQRAYMAHLRRLHGDRLQAECSWAMEAY